jgi:ABC-type uncharacterized transport system involved in gliding motility auxiliary subunit
VILAGPVKPLIPHEQDALRAYLARGGRLFAMINPGMDPGLDALLADYRLVLNDDMIVDQEEIAFLGARLGSIPRRGFPAAPDHQGVQAADPPVPGTIDHDQGRGGLPGVVTQPVARTRESAWGRPAGRT